MAPSPSVFLAAVAQRTKRLRFGPLVYTVNLYHPLRLIDEICMLDQMSGGRLELGIGRGISPYEVGYYGVDPATGPERFAEALDKLWSNELENDGLNKLVLRAGRAAPRPPRFNLWIFPGPLTFPRLMLLRSIQAATGVPSGARSSGRRSDRRASRGRRSPRSTPGAGCDSSTGCTSSPRAPPR